MEKFTYNNYHRDEEAEAKIKDRSVLFIDNEVAQELLPIDDCLNALEEVYQEMGRGYTTSSRATYHVPRPDGEGWYRWSPMVAGVTKLGVVAIRIKSDLDIRVQERHDWYCVTPGKYCGLILLFSAVDGAPLAIMNDGHIQHMRVGATGGLSAKYMARQDASVLGLFGSAGMASTHAWAIAKTRPIQKIKVYSPNAEHREAFARDMSRFLEIEVVALDEPRKVAEGSDILAAGTNSSAPVILGEWLEPGMHVLSVGPREFDDEVFRRTDRYAYSRTPSTQHYFAAPEDQRPPNMADGDPDTRWMRREQRLMAQEKMTFFSELALGRAVGRGNPSEVTCFTSQGIPIQFAALAYRTYELAKERGLGRELPLGWFLQDIHN